MLDPNKLRTIISEQIKDIPIDNAAYVCYVINNVIKALEDNYIIYERKK